MGTEKRLSAWVVHAPDEVEGVARLGPDQLDAACGVALKLEKPATDASRAPAVTGRPGDVTAVRESRPERG